MNKSLEFKMTLVGCIAVFIAIIGIAINVMRPRSASSTSIHKEVEDAYSTENEVIEIEIGKLYMGTDANIRALVKQWGRYLTEGIEGDYQIKDNKGNYISVTGSLNWIGPEAEDGQCEVGIWSKSTDQIYGKLQSFRLK